MASTYTEASAVAVGPRGSQSATAPGAASSGHSLRSSTGPGPLMSRSPTGTMTSMPSITTALTSAFMTALPFLERVQVLSCSLGVLLNVFKWRGRRLCGMT